MDHLIGGFLHELLAELFVGTHELKTFAEGHLRIGAFVHADYATELRLAWVFALLLLEFGVPVSSVAGFVIAIAPKPRKSANTAQAVYDVSDARDWH